jgi:hypothetical protein
MTAGGWFAILQPAIRVIYAAAAGQTIPSDCLRSCPEYHWPRLPPDECALPNSAVSDNLIR